MRNIVLFALLLFSSLGYSQSAYSTPINYNNQPVYQPDTKIVNDAMREKQGLHSSRKDLVFQKMEDIGRVIRKVKERKGGLTTQQKDYVNWLVEQSEKILKWDFSIGDNYYNAMQWLRKVEDTVLDWL